MHTVPGSNLFLYLSRSVVVCTPQNTSLLWHTQDCNTYLLRLVHKTVQLFYNTFAPCDCGNKALLLFSSLLFQLIAACRHYKTVHYRCKVLLEKYKNYIGQLNTSFKHTTPPLPHLTPTKEPG